MVCVISQFQEYVDGRGTAAFDVSDRLATVQYTATAHTITTSSAPSGRRRSTPKPMPSRCEPEEFSEAPSKVGTSSSDRAINNIHNAIKSFPKCSAACSQELEYASMLSKPRSGAKKHVQFPDEQSCIDEASEVPAPEPEKTGMDSSTKKDTAIRRRGPNYKEAEKKYLMDLVKRYENVIESKVTSTTIFAQKADAWKCLTNKYNASSTSGIRTSEQLKHLYENMKQTARKALATSNKAHYLHKLEEENVKEAEVVEPKYKPDDNDTLDWTTLKLLDKSDKIERKKTGGGCFTPVIQDKDLKILDLIKDQVKPLSSPFDSAALYFNDDLTQHQLIQETAAEATIEPEEEEIITVVEIRDDETEHKDNRKGRTVKKSNKTMKNRNRLVNKENNNCNNAQKYKTLYFKKKYENSMLQRRRIYQEIRLRQKEHQLLMKKIKLEISNLEKLN